MDDWPRDRPGRLRARTAAGMLALVAMLLAAGAALAAGERVRLEGKKLSVDFRDETLGTVFAELRREAGIEVRAPKDVAEQRVTVEFRDLDVERAVREILRRSGLKAHAVLYDAGKATFVVVKGDAPQGGEPPPPAEEPDEPEEPSPEATPPQAPQEIRSTRTPVYIPPLEEPKYIPPLEEPQYVPPAGEPLVFPGSPQLPDAR